MQYTFLNVLIGPRVIGAQVTYFYKCSYQKWFNEYIFDSYGQFISIIMIIYNVKRDDFRVKHCAHAHFPFQC